MKLIFQKKNKFINDDRKVSEVLNSYFDNIVTILDIKENTYITEKYQLIWNQYQSAFTCSKLTTETLEQGVKYVQKCNRRLG